MIRSFSRMPRCQDRNRIFRRRGSRSALLRVVLGVPDPALAHTNAGRGMLRRLLIGQPLRALLTDDDLVITAGLAAPRFDAGSGGR